MIDKTNFDYVIVGSGAIAWISSLYLSKYAKNASIALISELPRYFSASTAAGAMHAVFGEIEDDISKSKEENKSFEVALKSRKLWRELFDEYNLDSVITANDTVVYLQKEFSQFEYNNYELVKSLASQHSCLGDMSEMEITELFKHATERPSEAIKLKGEFSFCTEALFGKLEKTIKSQKNITMISSRCKNLNHTSNGDIKLETNTSDIISAKYVIVAAGSQTSKLLKEYPMQKMLQSVGAALKLDIPDMDHFKNIAIRSVNRGGAQCGIHAVPRTKSIYIGAGSYVTSPTEEPKYRTDTIKYLIDCSESELFGRSQIYMSSMETILGSRPRSIDARPLIGNFRNFPNLLVATGTNRVGLTWAPAIAEYILGMLNLKEIKDQEIFEDWNPDRNMIMFGSIDNCIDYYVSSRLSNEREHGLIESSSSSQDEKRIRDYAEKLVEKVNKTLNIDKNESVHPDGWGTIAGLSAEYKDQGNL